MPGVYGTYTCGQTDVRLTQHFQYYYLCIYTYALYKYLVSIKYINTYIYMYILNAVETYY